MSYTETHFGTVKRVQIDNDVTIEQWAELECKSLGFNEITGDDDDWVSTLKEETTAKYFFSMEGQVWKIADHMDIGLGAGFLVFTPEEDNIINFAVQFYNGGGCLEEVIERGINNLKH